MEGYEERRRKLRMIDTDIFTIVLPNPGTRGPGGVAPTGSTPGLVDPVEAPPLGPRLCHFCFFTIVLPNPRTRGPGAAAPTGSTPGLVDPVEAPPPGPRFISSVNPLEWLPRGQP